MLKLAVAWILLLRIANSLTVLKFMYVHVFASQSRYFIFTKVIGEDEDVQRLHAWSD